MRRHTCLPDTAFHRTMPRVAKLLPIPCRFDAKGVQRYGFLGIELNEQRNAANAEVISKDAGRVVVRVIRIDEELMIARSECRIC